MSVTNESFDNSPANIPGTVTKDLSESDLQLLNSSEALSLDETKIPIGLAEKIGLKSKNETSNILTSLIANSDSSNLQKLPYSVLNNSLDPKDRYDPYEHMVKPPTRFGTKSLDKEINDLIKVSNKTSRDSANIEHSLREANEIHSKFDYELSPRAFAELLKGLLPKHMLKLYYEITNKSSFTIKELYEDLSCVFGSLKPLPRLISDMHAKSDNYRSIWELVESFQTLLGESGKHFSTMSDLMIYEILRRIQTESGLTMTNQIRSQLESNPDRRDFRSLYKIIKDHYYQHFQKASKKHSNHHIDLVHNVNPANEKSDIKCYECGRLGHFAKNCRFKSNSFNNRNRISQVNNMTSTPLYCDAICSIHKSGHRNRECRAQMRTPCNFKENHSGHKSSDCRRPSNLPNPNVDSLIRPPSVSKPSAAPQPNSSIHHVDNLPRSRASSVSSHSSRQSD